jgi:hypothetical protein
LDPKGIRMHTVYIRNCSTATCFYFQLAKLWTDTRCQELKRGLLWPSPTGLITPPLSTSSQAPLGDNKARFLEKNIGNQYNSNPLRARVKNFSNPFRALFVAISRPKKVDFQGPPLPLALVINVATCPHKNHYDLRHLNNRYINSWCRLFLMLWDLSWSCTNEELDKFKVGLVKKHICVGNPSFPTLVKYFGLIKNIIPWIIVLEVYTIDDNVFCSVTSCADTREKFWAVRGPSTRLPCSPQVPQTPR